MNFMKNDIFERLRKKREQEKLYKVKKVIRAKDDGKALVDFLRNLNFHVKKKLQRCNFSDSGNSGRFNYGNWAGDKGQRVMYKQSYAFSKSSHNKFLLKYLPQMDKTYVIDKPELFGTPDNEYYDGQVGFHHKIIISPENPKGNLKELVEKFIGTLEQMTPYSNLLWKAAIHNDTEHKHVHLLINGKDGNGQTVWFDRTDIRNTFRQYLQYDYTQMIGNRGIEEIKLAKNRQLRSKRITQLDREIAGMDSLEDSVLSEKIKQRLDFLCEMGLAQKKDAAYEMNEKWLYILEATGRYNCFLDQYMKDGKELILYEGGKLKGKVVDVVTFEKDESWSDALIIDNGMNRVYVPVWQLNKEVKGKNVEISGGTRSLSRQISDKNITIDDSKYRDCNSFSHEN